MSTPPPLTLPLFNSSDPGRLEAAVRIFARSRQLFQAGARVVAAVSGGPDSVALLHLLHRLGPEWGLEVGVAHFDHGLRGEASREEARFVASLARQLGLPVHAGAGEVRRLAQADKISLQMAARQLRLGHLEQVRRDHAYDLIALGHTADDQVELFFLRLLRGAGAEGLKGMWPRTAGGLVRPLLAVGKELVLAWLHREQLPYRQDPGNLDCRYRRNHIRLELLPRLQQDYNPGLKSVVWRLMAHLQEDERLLAATAAQAWEQVGGWLTPDLAVLAIPALLALPPGLQTRLLRLGLGRFSLREITAAQVDSLLALARGRHSGGVIAWEGCQAARAGAELHLFRPLPPPPGPGPTLLAGPGQVEAPGGWRLQAREVLEPSALLSSPDAVRVDRARLTFPLSLRTIQPGDRFSAAFGPGSKKIQDYLVDAKIPRWLRPHLPLVVSGAGVVWLPGLHLAAAVRPTPDSPAVLELAVSPLNAAATRVWELLRVLRRRPPRAP